MGSVRSLPVPIELELDVEVIFRCFSQQRNEGCAQCGADAARDTRRKVEALLGILGILGLPGRVQYE